MSMFTFSGGFGDLCASTRVRLARNLKGYPYHDLTDTQKSEIADKVMDAITAAPAISEQFTRQTQENLARTTALFDESITSSIGQLDDTLSHVKETTQVSL